MLTIHWNDSGFSRARINAVAAKCKSRIKQLKQVVASHDEHDAAASLLLPLDSHQVSLCKFLARTCNDTSLLVVVGIGGSNLGTMAIQQAVFGTPPGMKVRYVDTVDADMLHEAVHDIRVTLNEGKNVTINIISKSGTTTETLANAAVLLGFARHKHCKIVITTDTGSPLEHTAHTLDIPVLSIPPHVGGRYSVFSAVSLFPLAVLGVNVERLVQGAQRMLDHCLRSDVAHNPALMLASIAYLQVKNGKQVHDTFVFANDLEAYGRWYRQLLAESLGKNHHTGIIPVTSVGSTDLHSVGQLDMAGPNIQYHRFVTVRNNHEAKVPPSSFDKIVNLNGLSFAKIMSAIIHGTQTAFRNRKKPFIQIDLPDKSAETIGALLQVEMVSVMLLGYLLGVNPFNQPDVEEYKIATRKALGR